MTIYCDLQMTTEQALAMLEFVQASRGEQLPAHLVELFDDQSDSCRTGLSSKRKIDPGRSHHLGRSTEHGHTKTSTPAG